MTRIILSLISLLFFSVSFAYETDGGDIRSVSVYRTGAIVKREFRAQLKKGENTVIVKGLPASVYSNTFRANPKAVGAVRVTDIETETTYLNKTATDKLAELEGRLDKVVQQIRKNKDEREVLVASRILLKEISPFSRNQKATMAEIEEYLKYTEKTLAAKSERIAAIDVTLAALEKQKESISKEMEKLGSESGETKNFRLSVLSSAETEADFEISYMVSGAGWSPLYEIRANSAGNSAEFSAYANIRQNTGEDWKNVSIEISTISPVFETAPVVKPWYMDIYKADYERSVSSFMMPKAVMAAPMMEMDAAAPEREVVSTEEMSSFTFAVDKKVSINSDGQPRRVFLQSETASAVFAYYAVPKAVEKVFLTADVKNPFAFPMFAGKMNIYLDDRLVTSTDRSGSLASDENISLSLGADDSVTVERKLKNKKTSGSGVFGGNTQIAYEYEIILRNAKKREITLDVKEPAPVSRNEKLKIETDYTRESSEMGEDGIIKWSLKLKPGEKRILTVKHKVEYPKDSRVTGLE
ncbi:DUF4139 domain-containing protein [Seleniivibrio woodruffii]|uniref:DUF4139 domain-containing protein n=1 Tax=Seleniivibrio woodruffii TaxID=1078050 RepID=UPI002409425F|nr:mucoidy inhibitor MuiA family protein [Seleniivibrio woodruffii]